MPCSSSFFPPISGFENFGFLVGLDRLNQHRLQRCMQVKNRADVLQTRWASVTNSAGYVDVRSSIRSDKLNFQHF